MWLTEFSKTKQHWMNDKTVAWTNNPHPPTPHCVSRILLRHTRHVHTHTAHCIDKVIPFECARADWKRNDVLEDMRWPMVHIRMKCVRLPYALWLPFIGTPTPIGEFEHSGSKSIAITISSVRCRQYGHAIVTTESRNYYISKWLVN